MHEIIFALMDLFVFLVLSLLLLLVLIAWGIVLGYVWTEIKAVFNYYKEKFNVSSRSGEAPREDGR